jgi:hypothetical protein
MSEALRALVERVRLLTVSDADAEAQRRSFAYGTLALEDPRVTRALIDEAAERLATQNVRLGR